MPDSQRNIVPEVLTEFIELAVYNILYIRKLYPETIFERNHKYGVVIYRSIHPQLNEYISHCMKAVLFLVKENQLSKVVICFNRPQQQLFEKVVFDIDKLNYINNASYLLLLERSFRSFFIRLHAANRFLKPFPSDVTFSLQIHTSEGNGLTCVENSKLQNFPWIMVNAYNTIPGSTILPLDTININDFPRIQIYIERCS